jgi:hypothetical protein
MLLALLGTGCGGSSSTAPTTTPTPAPEIKTEAFSGKLSPTGSAYHQFSVAATGALVATLTSLSPQTTITIGFGIGQPMVNATTSTTSCSLISGAYTESAKVGQSLSGTIAPGSFCVALYDVGNLASANDYVITVSHP